MRFATRRPLASSALAVGLMFLVNGIAYGSWVARLPEVRQALDVDDATLGLTLLGAGVGGTIMSLVSGRIVDRVGSRSSMIWTSVALSALVPAVALAPAAPILFAVLLVLGAVDGLTDVAQNSQALAVQEQVERSILTRMHAAWSMGALTGGVAASQAAAADISFTWHLTATGALLVCTTVVASRWLAHAPGRSREEAKEGRALVSRARLALLFGVGVLAILVEIPPTEWASLLMSERFDLGPGAAGLGFVAFTAGMVAGRVGGDVVVDRVGQERARRGGSLISVVGVAVVVVSPAPPVAWLGLLLAGAGASTLFPLAIRRASEMTLGTTAGVAAFSSGTRAGMLVGSPLMGAISEATTRTAALAAIAGTAAAATALLRLDSS